MTKLCPILLAADKPGLPNACLGEQCGRYNLCHGIITVYKPKIGIRTINE